MNTEPLLAILGPFDKPNETRRVEILRASEGAGRFLRCRDERGNELTVHINKLHTKETLQ